MSEVRLSFSAFCELIAHVSSRILFLLDVCIIVDSLRVHGYCILSSRLVVAVCVPALCS